MGGPASLVRDNSRNSRLALLFAFSFSVFQFFSVYGAHLFYDLNDLNVSGTISNRTVRVYPKSTPRAEGNELITSDYKTFTTASDGTFTLSNVVQGVYSNVVVGPRADTVFIILVPDTNVTLNVISLLSAGVLPSQQTGYSQAGANAIFVAKTNSWSISQSLSNAFFKGSTNVFGHTNGSPSAGSVLVTDGTNAHWSSVTPGGGADRIATNSGAGFRNTFFDSTNYASAVTATNFIKNLGWLYVNNDQTNDGSLHVNGPSVFTDAVTVNSPFVVNSISTFNDALTVNDSVVVGGTTFSLGTITSGQGLIVSNQSVFKGNIVASGLPGSGSIIGVGGSSFLMLTNAGPQTPYTSDHNAAGFSVTNLATVSLNGSNAQPGIITLYGTNQATFVQLSANKDVSSNATFWLPTHGMRGKSVGFIVATNFNGSTNQETIGGLGSGLSWDGTNISAAAQPGIEYLNGNGTNTSFYPSTTNNIPVIINGLSNQASNLLHILAPSGFTARYLDAKLNNVSKFAVKSDGSLQLAGGDAVEVWVTTATGANGSRAFHFNGYFNLVDGSGDELFRAKGSVFHVGSAVTVLGFGGATEAVPAFGRSAITSGHMKVTDGTGATSTNSLFFGNTVDTSATTGLTMNRQSGRIRLASGQQTFLVTNNLVSANSIIVATVNTDDTTALNAKAIPSSGLITLKCNAATTANTDISFLIIAQ